MTKVLVAHGVLAEQDLQQVVAALQADGIVAVPTETVYGLAANAMSDVAVAKVFAAKGRPAANPLIVHVADRHAAQALTACWPECAEVLARRFWPGPLTIVLPHRGTVSPLVTAGGDTVALRVPAHTALLQILQQAQLPLAAPSANHSESLSPTTAEHVLQSLGNSIDLLVDGGACTHGVESTVLDLTTTPPTLLRPGALPIRMIEAMIGPVQRSAVSQGVARSPGLQARHYAPSVPLELHTGNAAERVQSLVANGQRIGWLQWHSDPHFPGTVTAFAMPTTPIDYAAQLFARLHALQQAGVERIVVELPPTEDAWLAIHDRLQRAATTE